jgi:hypothetical protein
MPLPWCAGQLSPRHHAPPKETATKWDGVMAEKSANCHTVVRTVYQLLQHGDFSPSEPCEQGHVVGLAVPLSEYAPIFARIYPAKEQGGTYKTL